MHESPLIEDKAQLEMSSQQNHPWCISSPPMLYGHLDSLVTTCMQAMKDFVHRGNM